MGLRSLTMIARLPKELSCKDVFWRPSFFVLFHSFKKKKTFADRGGGKGVHRGNLGVTIQLDTVKSQLRKKVI